MEFPRQEHWRGLPFPSPEGLPDPGIEPESPALAGVFFTTSATWEAYIDTDIDIDIDIGIKICIDGRTWNWCATVHGAAKGWT